MAARDLGGGARAWRVLALTAAFAACSDTGERAGQSAQGDGAGSGWKVVVAIDFDGDGLADVLWSNPARDRLAVFLMNGTRLFEPGPEIPGPRGVEWSAVTAADFDLDGLADVTWWSPVENRAAVWRMEGTHLAYPGPEIPAPAGDGWALAYAADFDGDGIADLLWHNPERRLFTVWRMRGTGVAEPGPELPGPAGDGWTIPSAGDFNLDGLADVLWYNTLHHQIAVWLMRGTAILEQGPAIPGPAGDAWEAAITTADFNRDGIQDVVWNDAERNVMAVWLMEATHVLHAGPEIPGPAGDGWVVGSAGDTDGDGMADIVWQNSAADRMAVWPMSGTRVLGYGPEIPGPP